MAAGLAARDAIGTTRNRVESTRARWRAEGCFERARAAAEAALATASNAAFGAWDSLDTVVRESDGLAGSDCNVTVEASGIRLDANSASAERIRLSLRALGAAALLADSLTDALIDWRDADDAMSPAGAESDWYALEERIGPRNAPLGNAAELTLIRGFGELEPARSLFDVEPLGTAINHAPYAVLAALPAFTPELTASVLERRARGTPIADLASLGSLVSADARDQLMARFPELAAAATIHPVAWSFTSSVASEPGEPVRARLVVRVERAGDRLAIMRRSVWP